MFSSLRAWVPLVGLEWTIQVRVIMALVQGCQRHPAMYPLFMPRHTQALNLTGEPRGLPDALSGFIIGSRTKSQTLQDKGQVLHPEIHRSRQEQSCQTESWFLHAVADMAERAPTATHPQTLTPSSWASLASLRRRRLGLLKVPLPFKTGCSLSVDLLVKFPDSALEWWAGVMSGLWSLEFFVPHR